MRQIQLLARAKLQISTRLRIDLCMMFTQIDSICVFLQSDRKIRHRWICLFTDRLNRCVKWTQIDSITLLFYTDRIDLCLIFRSNRSVSHFYTDLSFLNTDRIDLCLFCTPIDSICVLFLHTDRIDLCVKLTKIDSVCKNYTDRFDLCVNKT